jgi:transposase
VEEVCSRKFAKKIRDLAHPNDVPGAYATVRWKPGNKKRTYSQRGPNKRRNSAHVPTTVNLAPVYFVVRSSCLASQYARLRGRRGSKKAAVAVGHSILVIAYHVLEREVPYEDLGEDYFHR